MDFFSCFDCTKAIDHAIKNPDLNGRDFFCSFPRALLRKAKI